MLVSTLKVKRRFCLKRAKEKEGGCFKLSKLEIETREAAQKIIRQRQHQAGGFQIIVGEEWKDTQLFGFFF